VPVVKFFIAGIMQGSKVQNSIFGQDYRQEISGLIRSAFPEAEIYDPFAKNQDSITYSKGTGLATFLGHNKMCGTEVDVLIAFVPEASMGTAIEMWEAWKNHALVISISPMKHNWAIKFLSHIIYPDIPAFADAIRKGDVQKAVKNHCAG